MSSFYPPDLGDGPALALLTAVVTQARRDARRDVAAGEWLTELAELAADARPSRRWRIGEGRPAAQGELVAAARALGWPEQPQPGAVTALAERFGVAVSTVYLHLRRELDGAPALATTAD